MFKKTLYFSYILFLVLFSSFGQVSYAAQTVEERNTQASQIATEIGISQDAWFSTSQRTMNTIQQGLLEIDNQKTFLREKGIAETEIAKVEGAQMSALKSYAQATHEQENIGIFTGSEKTKALNGNLLAAQANFAKTLANIYTMNGLETESKIYNDSAKETQEKADLAYQGKSTRDVVVVESKPLIIPGGPDKYTLLARIDTFFPGGTIDVKGGGLGGYLNGLYRAGIAIATGLALVMIVVGGLEYVSTDSIQGKSNGRERIKNAIIGLLLALTSFIILRQINPNLLKSDLNVESTKSTGTVGGSAIDLVNRPVDSLDAYPLTQQLVNNGLTGNGQFNIYGNTPTGSVSFVAAPGSRVIGGGKVEIDYDGSPGAYKLTESSNGPYIIRGKRYYSSSYEHVANARSDIAMSTADMKPGGRWVGVQTSSDGEPVINKDGSLIGVLSIGAGKINGDTTAFVALSSGQVLAAKTKYGVDLKPSLGTTVILSANGKSIRAIYADYAGTRSTDYSEVSPAAAKALGISFGKQNGKSYASGSVTISLP